MVQPTDSMTPRARIMLHAKAKDGHREEFERAFPVVAERMRSASGFIQDELLRAGDGENPAYIVMSEWVNKDAFWTWFHDPVHHEMTAPMSPYWYDARIDVYDLVHRLERYDPGSS